MQVNSDHACIKTKKQYCWTVLVSRERGVRSPALALQNASALRHEGATHVDMM